MAQKKKIDLTLLIDIGTTSVGATLVQVGKTNTPLLTKVTRVPVGSGTSDSRKALLTNTEEALKKLLETYAKGPPPDRIHVVVASPWHEAHIRTITSTSERPVRISEKTVFSAVQKYQNEKPPNEGNVDIEAVAVHVQVNGYSTALQRAISGTDISVNLYESEMRSDLQKKSRDGEIPEDDKFALKEEMESIVKEGNEKLESFLVKKEAEIKI